MLKVRASFSLHEVMGDAPSDLRARLTALTGQHFRRINRFIELSLLGAFQLRERAGGVAGDAAVYVACKSPMLGDSVRLVQYIVRDRRPPSPFEFMNVSGNMAGFYIGQQLGLNGPQLALHGTHAPFAAALELLSLQSAHHRRALLGYVEEGVWPVDEHRHRIEHCGEDQAIAECSHWLYIDQDCEDPIASIGHQRYDDAAQALRELQQADEPWLLVPENFIVSESWLSALPRVGCDADDEDGSYSSGRSAQAICRFIEQAKAARLVHLDRSDNGEYHAITVQRY